jgi:hypothetical protein
VLDLIYSVSRLPLGSMTKTIPLRHSFEKEIRIRAVTHYSEVTVPYIIELRYVTVLSQISSSQSDMNVRKFEMGHDLN